MRSPPGSIYKRLESDAEFRARLIAAGADAAQAGWRYGEKLDEWGWSERKMQRRIVEDCVVREDRMKS